MKIVFHRNFSKSYRRLTPKLKNQFKRKLKLFLEDPLNPLLNNHALHGAWRRFRSINISGDWRTIYQPVGDDSIEFVIIDTHSNLYP